VKQNVPAITIFNLIVLYEQNIMGAQYKTTKLENSTYDILIALGKEAQFLYSAVDNYTSDAKKENKSDLVNMWNTIKQDRTRHMQIL
jgi:hypothetical protein